MKIDWKHNLFLKITGVPVFLFVLPMVFYYFNPYPSSAAEEFLLLVWIIGIIPGAILFFLNIAVSLMRIKTLDVVDIVLFVSCVLFPVFYFLQ